MANSTTPNARGVADVAADDRFHYRLEQARKHQQQPGQHQTSALERRGAPQRPALRRAGQRPETQPRS